MSSHSFLSRWVSYYRDTPVLEVSPDGIATVRGADPVLVRVGRMPVAIEAGVESVAGWGHYALFNTESLTR